MAYQKKTDRQLWRGIEIEYQPKQAEARNALKKHRYVFYGGAKGGGKSWLQRATHIEWITKKRNVTTAIIRRHYKEVKTNHIDKILAEYPELQDYYKKTDQCIYIPENQSRLYFGHCKDESDLEKWKGIEIQLLGIDEVDNIPWQWVVKLLQSNRSSDVAVRARTLLTGNPGGVCHNWLKRVFIDRDFREREKPENYWFVQALLEDNRYISNGDYEDALELEPNEQIRKAYRWGNWDIQAGEFFHEFTLERHVIPKKDPKTDLKDWFKFGALDWGYYHPACFGWFAVNPRTQQVILYRELLEREMNVKDFKEEVFKYEDSDELQFVVAGKDCWLRQRDGSPSVADQFELKSADEKALFLQKANTDRKQGWNQVRTFLAKHKFTDEDGEDYEEPRFMITKDCHFTIECLPRMQHKKNDPEDCETINCHADDDLGSGDDQAQMVRYGLMAVPMYGKLIHSSQRGRDRYKNGKRRTPRGNLTWAVI